MQARKEESCFERQGNIVFQLLLAGSERRRASRAQETGKPVIEQSTKNRRLLAWEKVSPLGKHGRRAGRERTGLTHQAEGVIERKRWKAGDRSGDVSPGELPVVKLVERFDPEGSKRTWRGVEISWNAGALEIGVSPQGLRRFPVRKRRGRPGAMTR